MSDQSPRIDPYHLVFGAESVDDRLFPPIAEEAATRDLPLRDPDRFLFLSSVGKLLQAIAGEPAYGDSDADPADSEADADPEADSEADSEASPEREALRQYGRLLFHAFHHWQGEKRSVDMPEDRLRWLLEEVSSVGDWSLRAPSRAGYLRLPRNLVWAAPAPGLQPEPADGFFWLLDEEGDAPALHVLLALGVREDRPGFSVVPATGVADDEPHWAEADARPGATDFENTLPGGELDRLYSVENAAELLKLASLCFWELDPASG